MAWAWGLGGRVEEAAELARSSLVRADPVSWIAIDLGTVLLYVEDYPGARKALEAVAAGSRRAGATSFLGYALDQLAKIETREGSLTRAYALELESLQLNEPLGNEVALAANLVWLGLLESMLGRPDARSRAERALAIAERLGDPWNAARARGVLGQTALVHGDASEAVAWLEAGVDAVAAADVHPNYLRLEGDYIEALVRSGRPDAAETHLVRLERHAKSTGSPWCAATSARCRALAAPPHEAAALFEAALDLHQAEPSPFERARTQLCYGERLRRAGERRAARERLRSALAVFEGVGAAPWAERARMELRASGERLRPRRPAATERLTPQELQIALLVAEGLTNRDVAARMFLSPKTVEFHLTRVYGKLEIHSRADLVRRRLEGSRDLQQAGAPE